MVLKFTPIKRNISFFLPSSSSNNIFCITQTPCFSFKSPIKLLNKKNYIKKVYIHCFYCRYIFLYVITTI